MPVALEGHAENPVGEARLERGLVGTLAEAGALHLQLLVFHQHQFHPPCLWVPGCQYMLQLVLHPVLHLVLLLVVQQVSQLVLQPVLQLVLQLVLQSARQLMLQLVLQLVSCQVEQGVLTLELVAGHDWVLALQQLQQIQH